MSERQKTFFLLSLFFLFRLSFINSQAVFFDSGEYLNLFAKSNFLQALYYGHFPLHIGYIILGWPIYHLAEVLKINPGNAVILAQIVLQTLAIYCFYKFVSFISDKKTALLTILFISLTPFFWVSNVTIMMENAYFISFCFSLYFLGKFLKKNRLINLHLSAFFLTFAILTHLLVALWIPFYLFIVFWKQKHSLVPVILMNFAYLMDFWVANIFLISKVLNMPPSQVFFYIFLSKQQELSFFALNGRSILIVMRNFILPLFSNFSGLLIILGSLSLLANVKKNLNLALLGFLWIAPAFLANQWWDSLFPGRHSLIAALGFAFMSAYLLRNKPKLAFLFTVYLAFISIPTLSLLKQSTPYLEEAKFVKTLPSNSLFIETHFARPQVQNEFRGKLLSVNQGGSENSVINSTIKQYLHDQKPVFISSGAISEPYGLYAGPYLHSLTLSYIHNFQLENVIKNYTLKPYKTIDQKDNLLIYKIVSDKPSNYPDVQRLKNSKRRIDFYDPFSRSLTYFLFR